MPSWTPGSYLLREFPRNVVQFEAADGAWKPLPFAQDGQGHLAGGRPGGRHPARPVDRERRRAHRAHLARGRHARVRHRRGRVHVRGRAPGRAGGGGGARAGGVARHHGAARRWPRRGSARRTSTSWWIRPWRSARTSWCAGRWTASSTSTPCGAAATPTPGAWRSDTTRIVLAEREIFGGLPYPAFTFILHLTSGGGGGLEHRNCTSLLADRWSFRGAAVRELPGAGRARALPRVERQAHPPRRAGPVRLHARELHPRPVGGGGDHHLLHGPAPAPRGDHPPAAVPGEAGGDDLPLPHAPRPRRAAAGGFVVRHLDQVLPAGRQHAQRHHLLLPEGRAGGPAAGPAHPRRPRRTRGRWTT